MEQFEYGDPDAFVFLRAFIQLDPSVFERVVESSVRRLDGSSAQPVSKIVDGGSLESTNPSIMTVAIVTSFLKTDVQNNLITPRFLGSYMSDILS
ncbi:hypothetical protein FQN57_002863 [Myotisia sp. PD_48]|nr:hypothetical protein FQN57_002863 [Myotisia sp. PD_48]